MNPTRTLILFTALGLCLTTGALRAQRTGQGGPPAGQTPAARQADRPAERRMEDRDTRQDRDRLREHMPEDRPQRASLAERMEPRADWCRELGLTEQQQADVEQIRERQRSEIQAVDRRWFITRTQKQERIREIIARHDGEVRALLTQEQLRLLEMLRMRDQEQLRLREQEQERPQN